MRISDWSSDVCSSDLCNTAIERCGSFDTVVRTRIGSPHVIAAMDQQAASGLPVAGFEANGGFLLGSRIDSPRGPLAPLPTRDAALPVLRSEEHTSELPSLMRISYAVF